jgi:tryptophan synthase beta subunit
MLHCMLQVDPEFKAELRRLRREFIGGPTPIYHARHALRRRFTITRRLHCGASLDSTLAGG